jgi:hypothetical protein
MGRVYLVSAHGISPGFLFVRRFTKGLPPSHWPGKYARGNAVPAARDIVRGRSRSSPLEQDPRSRASRRTRLYRAPIG